MSTTGLHINDLAGGNIISNILYKYIAVHPLHEDMGVGLYAELFRLATTCRQWMEYLKPSICRRAFFVYIPYEYINWRGKVVNRYKWVTNVGFITSAGMTQMTTNLVIYGGLQDWSGLSFIPTMKNCRFSEFEWDNVKTLTIGTVGKLSNEDAYNYLTRTLPAITRICYEEIFSIFEDLKKLVTILLAYYSHQIETYHAYDRYSLDGFPRNFKDLTCLDVSLRSMVLFMKVRNVPIKCLQVLQLKGLVDEASWSAFEHRPNEPVVFQELRELSLRFSTCYFPVEPRSFAKCNLRFPKLQKLCAYDALDRFPDFYRTFLDSALLDIQIYEKDINMQLVPPELVSGVQRLEVVDLTKIWNQQSVPSSLSTSLLAIHSSIRTAILASLGPVDCTSVNWRCLQKLQLNPRYIPYQDIDRLLPHLPRLWCLGISARSSTEYERDIWDYSSGDVASSEPPLSTSLQHLVIKIINSDGVVINIKWLQQLIVRAPALQRLDIPVEYASEFVQFTEDQERDIHFCRPAIPRHDNPSQQDTVMVQGTSRSQIGSVRRHIQSLVNKWRQSDD